MSMRSSFVVAAVVVASGFALAAGCAQIIGADFDKPFANGGGAGPTGATSTSTGTTSSSGSVSVGSTSASSSTGAGPFCGNGVCDPEDDCSCADCPAQCGDGCCQATEDWCHCPADCKPEMDVCGDACCGPTDPASCPTDCNPTCGDGVCKSEDGDNCTTCPNECPCPGLCMDGACLLANGETCDSGPQCGTGNCVDLICCALPCDAGCQTCAVDGTGCVDLPSNPVCPGNETCVGSFCQCKDGLKDGLETDIDCGSDCGLLLCGVGNACGVDGDCASGHCCDCAAAGLLCENDCATDCPM
ncbi:MAG: hypothetical protein U0414_23340 [Polyangiaceae bacterium]